MGVRGQSGGIGGKGSAREHMGGGGVTGQSRAFRKLPVHIERDLVSLSDYGDLVECTVTSVLTCPNCGLGVVTHSNELYLSVIHRQGYTVKT